MDAIDKEKKILYLQKRLSTNCPNLHQILIITKQLGHIYTQKNNQLNVYYFN